MYIFCLNKKGTFENQKFDFWTKICGIWKKHHNAKFSTEKSYTNLNSHIFWSNVYFFFSLKKKHFWKSKIWFLNQNMWNMEETSEYEVICLKIFLLHENQYRLLLIFTSSSYEKVLVSCEKSISKFSWNLYVLRPPESEKQFLRKCLSVCPVSVDTITLDRIIGLEWNLAQLLRARKEKKFVN